MKFCCHFRDTCLDMILEWTVRLARIILIFYVTYKWNWSKSSLWLSVYVKHYNSSVWLLNQIRLDCGIEKWSSSYQITDADNNPEGICKTMEAPLYIWMVKFGITNLFYACYMWCILCSTKSLVYIHSYEGTYCACLRPYIYLLLVLYTNLRRLKLIIYHISWQLKHYFYIKTTHCLIYYTEMNATFLAGYTHNIS